MDRRRFVTTSGLALMPFLPRLRGLERMAGDDASAATDAALAQRLAADRFRPQIHLLPAKNWMNDPCAPRFHAGRYHVFMQYNPGASVWGDMHWAHATSTDMLHWRHEGIALEPTAGGPDAAGCFTGSVLPDAAVPTIIYTGVTRVPKAEGTIPNEGLREAQCLATAASDDLSRWTKQPEAILPSPPEGLAVTGFRDPCPWREGKTLYMGVGSGFPGKGGAVLLYGSADGHSWRYLHPLVEGQGNGKTATDPVDSGEMWECPDFFEMEGLHVLLYSTERKVYWQTGTLNRKTMRFEAAQQGLLDHGAFYAPKSMLAADGRRILWGWVPERRPEAEHAAAGWAGMMSLPRLLTLDAHGRLRMAPLPELTRLRAAPLPIKRAATRTSGTMVLPGRLGVIDFEWRPSAGSPQLRLEVAGAAAGAGALLETGEPGPGEPDSKVHSLVLGGKSLPLRPDAAGLCQASVWVDGSVAEVFVDGYEVLTHRFYGDPAATLQLSWTAAAPLEFRALGYALKPISPDRLTT